MSRVAKSSIIYYHGNNWDGVPGRQRLLMTALSKYYKIVYLDGYTKKKYRVYHLSPCDDIFVINGLISIVDSFKRRRLSYLARIMFKMHISRYVNSTSKTIYWEAENCNQFNLLLDYDLFIHDLIDPCFGAGEDLFWAREKQQTGKADIVLCTSSELFEAVEKYSSNIHLVPNACSLADFESEHDSKIRNTHRFNVICLGTIDNRIDFELLEQLAKTLPEVDFSLIGPITDEVMPKVTLLSRNKNILTPGPKYNSDVKKALNHADVCLIPYLVNKTNDALNPVRIYHYLAAGKPVITSNTRECRKLQSYVSVCNSTAEISSLIDSIKNNDSKIDVKSGLDFARRNTWEVRAEQVHNLIKDYSL